MSMAAGNSEAMYVDTTPLPPAVKGDKEILTDKMREEIFALNGARPKEFVFQLVYAWVVIVAAIGFAISAQSVWVSVLAIIVVATRQNVLGLLVHEQAHRLGFTGRYGDLIGNLFAAYPMMVLTVEGYAQVHLAHHKFYFKPQDPDFLRKSGADWSIPMPRGRFLRLLLTDVLGINTFALIRGKKHEAPEYLSNRPFPTPSWVRFMYYIVVAAALTWAQAWGTFLLYWLLPLMTVTQVIIRWGAICEHKYNLPDASVSESTPLIVLPWWQKLLLPNLNFAMHPYHHYFPGVAYCNLPRVHEIYAREGMLNEQNLFRGYGAYLRYILKPST